MLGIEYIVFGVALSLKQIMQLMIVTYAAVTVVLLRVGNRNG